ncbi:hypothetical protein [Roseibium aestuarii]|uniref:Uncharacterized protein n=1 Tax=Roseibium aestuarii TaxID=2600299 RepID=A0ABW4JWN5_9HYPH|nr:hypothetical protein [Roseibium aestuarii]
MNGVDWFPLVFFPLKFIVLGVGMFYSIKWHYDQDKKKEAEEQAQRELQQASAAEHALAEAKTS